MICTGNGSSSARSSSVVSGCLTFYFPITNFISRLPSLERWIRGSFTKCLLICQNLVVFHLQNLWILYLFQWVKVEKRTVGSKKEKKNQPTKVSPFDHLLFQCVWQHLISAFRWCSQTVKFAVNFRNTLFLSNELMFIIAMTLKKKKINFSTLFHVLSPYFHIALKYWQLLFKSKGKSKIIYIIHHSSLAWINYKTPRQINWGEKNNLHQTLYLCA